jgi:hypothetical protein
MSVITMTIVGMTKIGSMRGGITKLNYVPRLCASLMCLAYVPDQAPCNRILH